MIDVVPLDACNVVGDVNLVKDPVAVLYMEDLMTVKLGQIPNEETSSLP